VDTGMAKWAMQTTPHDEWDYDATNEVILHEQKDKNNKTKTYATQINKNGFIYTWQADNGSLIAAEKVHPFVNWATSVDLKTGVPSKAATASTHQDYNAKNICPSNMGAKSITPAAYSPKTGFLYVPLNLTCMTYEPVKSEYTSGQPWVGATMTLFSYENSFFWNGPGTGFGEISAINALNGKLVWRNKEKFAVWSGVLATSSNLVFYGTLDRWFKVIDAKTGHELFKSQVGSGLIGNPFTFSHKGKQLVGTYSAFGGWAGVAANLTYCDDTCGAMWSLGDFAYITKYNARPSGGAINIFSL
jgi:lanthanide-dependent methanol dehydrogenase